MESKVCTKCGIEKSVSEFNFRNDTNNYRSNCKSCHAITTKKYRENNPEKVKALKKEYSFNNKEQIKIYKKEYNTINKEKIAEKARNRSIKNKEKNKKYKSKYYLDNKEELGKTNKQYAIKNKEIIKQYKKEWYEANKERLTEEYKIYYEKNKGRIADYSKLYYKNNKQYIAKRALAYITALLKSDALFKLSTRIRNAISKAIKSKGFTKNKKTIEMLGCSFEEFKTYLESKFETWMNWSNYGKYNGELNFGFDIDHIIPLCVAKTEEEIIKLNHYTNLQPLCSKVNRDIKKGNII